MRSCISGSIFTATETAGECFILQGLSPFTTAAMTRTSIVIKTSVIGADTNLASRALLFSSIFEPRPV